MRVIKTEHFIITEVNKPKLSETQRYLLAHYFYKLIMQDLAKEQNATKKQ